MIQNSVRALVETKLREANGQGEGLLLLYENQPDTHVDGEPFLSAWTIFGNTLIKGVGKKARKELIGFVQIDSLVPIGEGLGDAKRRGDELSQVFSQKSFPVGLSTIFFNEARETVLPVYGGYQRVMNRVGFWVSLVSH